MLKAGAIGTALGVAGAGAAIAIGDAISGPLATTAPGGTSEEVALAGAMIGAAFAGAMAVGLAAGAKRFLGNPASAFLAMCAIGLVVSGGAAFALADDLATGVWLNVAHIAAAIPIVGSLANVLPTSNENRNSLAATA